MKKNKSDKKIAATNKKAYHDYFVEDTMEVGIALVGCEVKSVRESQVNLRDSYVSVVDGNLILKSCYIKVYDKGSFSNVESRRDRRLLAHKSEIRRWHQKVKEKGYSMVPLSMYFAGSLVKLEIALVRGKQLFDKREAIAKKDAERARLREEAE